MSHDALALAFRSFHLPTMAVIWEENNGDGRFTAVVDDPVVTQYANSGGVAWGNYDNDGYVDLFIANTDYEPDFLFHNERDGSFTRICGSAAMAGTLVAVSRIPSRKAGLVVFIIVTGRKPFSAT